MNEQRYFSLLKENKLEEALELSKEFLENESPSAHHCYNHAILAYELDQIEEAVWALKKAKEILPNCPIVRRILGEFLLRTGHFKEGFADREWRFTFPTPESPTAGMPIWGEILPRIRQCYKAPYWDGSDLKGKTLLVFNEAGFGDMIQQIRYLPRLGAKIIVEAKQELYDLFQCLPVEQVISVDRKQNIMATFTNQCVKLPPHDFVVSSESFPHFLDPDLTNIPMVFPYLTPQKTDCVALEKVKSISNKFKIGIVWAGNEKEETDQFRSCPVKHFHHLNKPNIQLFSLQKGKMKRRWPDKTSFYDVDLLADSKTSFIDLQDDLSNFNDTAQVIQELDLVIAVDTAAIHLAGALNKPVWLLASKRTHEWRWSKNWYDNFKLYRQKSLGDWDELLERISKDLPK